MIGLGEDKAPSTFFSSALKKTYFEVKIGITPEHKTLVAKNAKLEMR
jgi:hypothetical protein